MAVWTVLIDGPFSVAEEFAALRKEAHRLGRTVVGEPQVTDVVNEQGERRYWLTVAVEHATWADRAVSDGS